MLEIRNVSRIYKPKKGLPVKALDNVSLKFPEKGMVFILGKSGSGKSTLLNVLGGLDRADAGEIIIKGKSSKDFSQSDFDSYRNTYLGFVFQEYNILNEFTVGANIGLALELQGKKATSQEINRILEEVDLVGYGSRKPHELSGGQKQRVAIARALVKNPEIILADEPTGALDSKTGIQVFETLKRLSKDKLVIVVTHDREYAEYYGDRVIEFKDGRIISDIEKYVAPSFKKNPHISIVDNKIITIKQGYQLTDEDVRLINEYIRNHNAIISIDDRANEDLRKFARIDLEGNKEAFKETDESKIYIGEDKKFKLIKSRLPWKNSFKIGASGLKSKPFRLVLTILLSIVAFTMAGLSDTMGAYNKYTVTAQSYIDSGLNSYVLQKLKTVYREDYGQNVTSDINANEEDLARLKERTGLNFKGVYSPSALYFNLSNYAYSSGGSNDIVVLYQTNGFSGFYEITDDSLDELGFRYTGTLPQDDTQVAISKYVFDFFDRYGYSYNELRLQADEINTVQGFLNNNPKINLYSQEFTITAIIDTDFNYERFELLNKTQEQLYSENSINYWLKYEELTQTILYGYHGMFFVNEGFIGRARDAVANLYVNDSGIYINTEPYIYISSVIQKDRIDQENLIFFDNQKSKLNSGEVMLAFESYMSYLESRFNFYYGELLYRSYMPEWLKNYYDNMDQDAKDNVIENIVNGNLPSDNPEFNTFTMYYDNNILSKHETQNMEIAGVYINYNGDYYQAPVVLDDSFYNELLESIGGYYTFLIAPMPSGKSDILNLVKFGYDNSFDGGVSYSMKNGVMTILRQVNNFIETLAKVFLYIGIGFAVFSALLLMNFISISISYKSKEIGILRAIGARSSDVFGIFFNESMIIALINYALSVIATVLGVYWINTALRSEYGLLITLLVFGIRQLGLMLAISVGVAFIASFFPVMRVARKKPVDAMKK